MWEEMGMFSTSKCGRPRMSDIVSEDGLADVESALYIIDRTVLTIPDQTATECSVPRKYSPNPFRPL